ncbi:MAG: hypothetical protein ACNYPE_10585 [Candidatus Azotimanducaceae bacterium WSBS_2022_MAG_OTU7]
MPYFHNGRFYTLACDKLPGGRGFGEPLTLMIKPGNNARTINMMLAKAGKVLMAARSGMVL